MDKNILITSSVLNADFCNLSADIEMINDSQADFIHLDIMDGMFVPNISFGFPVVEAISKMARKPLEAHLMIEQPDRYVERFAKAGCSWLSVHYEACPHLHRSLQLIRNCGMKSGIALNPHTPVHLLEDILDMADLVILMSVNPGFGGQKFIPATMGKIEKLRAMIDKAGLNTLIEIDGGVNKDNVASLLNAGADMVVAGSAVFKADNPLEYIQLMKEAR